MIFDTLKEKYVEEAVKLAQEAYDREKQQINALYQCDYSKILTEYLSEIFKSKYGIVAIDNNKVVGYLSYWGGFEGHFGHVKGSYSPLFANAVGGGDREKLTMLMLQHAAEEMIKESIGSYAITTYSHDVDMRKALVLNGFGIRCADAIRDVSTPLDIQINPKCSYEELHHSEAYSILSLKNALIKHLRKSPVFCPNNEYSEKDFIDLCNRRQSRFFVAKDKNEIVGYIEIQNDGETFVTEDSDMLNICGAYLNEYYRGKNIFQSLLVFVLETIKNEGIKRLGVDFETINPTALYFWGKYFDNYTYSYVRRIDERILI